MEKAGKGFRLFVSATVVFWLATSGMFIYDNYLAAQEELPPLQASDITPGDEWRNVYFKGEKIGFGHQSVLDLEGGGKRYREESQLRIVAMSKVQDIRTKTSADFDENMALQKFTFEYEAGPASMNVAGFVSDSGIEIEITQGKEVTKDFIRLPERPTVAFSLNELVKRDGFEVGRVYRYPMFDPSTMASSRVKIKVESKEPYKVGDGVIEVYKLTSEFKRFVTTAYVTPEGITLREESPVGFVSVRTTQDQALAPPENSPVLDVVDLSSVAPQKSVDTGRDTGYLKITIQNVDTAGYALSGGRQKFTDGVLEVTGERLLPESGPLPTQVNRDDPQLKPNAYLQLNDPELQKAAREAVIGAADVSTAVHKLVDWVYTNLEKEATASLPSASEVLRMRQGDCNEHATLYAALARIVGIPTKIVAGLVYLDGRFYYHAWNESRIGDTWVAVDPVFGQAPADATHLRFIEGGLESQVEVLGLIGQLQLEVIEYR